MYSQSNIIRIDLEAVIARYMASSWKNIPSAFRSLIVRLVHRILSLDQIEYLLNSHPGARGVSLLDDIFEYLDVFLSLFLRES